MTRAETLHRCECGRIAEWHYVISRGESSQTLSPKFGLSAGTKCWAPGQGTIGVEPHILNPDFANPLTLADLTVQR